MNSPPYHLDDDRLLALLDGELTRGEAAQARSHLDACEPCRRRYEALADRAGRVRQWLERHDSAPPGRDAYDFGAPAPGRSSRRFGLGWAAAAALVLATSVVAGPARGWITERLGLSGDDLTAAAGPAAATSFMPEVDTLLVNFTAADAVRELTVEASADDRVHLYAPDDAVDLLVDPSGVAIADGSTTPRAYTLHVPRTVTHLLIRHPSSGDRLVPAQTLAAPMLVRVGRED